MAESQQLSQIPDWMIGDQIPPWYLPRRWDQDRQPIPTALHTWKFLGIPPQIRFFHQGFIILHQVLRISHKFRPKLCRPGLLRSNFCPDDLFRITLLRIPKSLATVSPCVFSRWRRVPCFRHPSSYSWWWKKGQCPRQLKKKASRRKMPSSPCMGWNNEVTLQILQTWRVVLLLLWPTLANKFSNSDDEMDKFPYRHNFMKLTKEETLSHKKQWTELIHWWTLPNPQGRLYQT